LAAFFRIRLALNLVFDQEFDISRRREVVMDIDQAGLGYVLRRQPAVEEECARGACREPG
jgi:hypothetical protein